MKDTTMRKPERFDENEPLLENGVLDSGAWRAAVAPEELRETLLEQTCAAVRFRARRRRMLLGGAVAAAYAAGLITAFLAFGGTPESPGTTPVLSEVAHSTPLPETPPAGPVFGATRVSFMTRRILSGVMPRGFRASWAVPRVPMSAP